jgi:ribosomal protein L3
LAAASSLPALVAAHPANRQSAMIAKAAATYFTAAHFTTPGEFVDLESNGSGRTRQGAVRRLLYRVSAVISTTSRRSCHRRLATILPGFDSFRKQLKIGSSLRLQHPRCQQETNHE